MLLKELVLGANKNTFSGGKMKTCIRMGDNSVLKIIMLAVWPQVAFYGDAEAKV